jgi:hypothetical protein
MEDKTKIPIDRQAVIIIHGIGEQKPMDTLRSFAEGIRKYLSKTDVTEQTATLRSKPDSISATYETRVLSLSGTRNRPITDFYEFYWAHNMRDTAFSHITKWLTHLVFITPEKVPPRQRPLYYTIWALIILLLLFPLILWFVIGIKKIQTVLAAFAAIPVLLLVLSLVQKYISGLFLATAGDAARYFTPIPSNIEQRNTIRRQGIEFLKKMHEQTGNGKYDRIVIVAHSLGTAVAYDLLRLLWPEYHEVFEKKADVQQELVKDMNDFAKTPESITDADAFQKLQYQLWQEWRNTGNPWLITDFITLGAAVCGIDYLSPIKQDFSTLVQQREFSVCPPATDEKDHNIFYNSKTYETAAGQKRTVRHLHHAAHFAITRWTNIFFTSDFVGSTAQRIFGKGVKDVALSRKSLWFIPGGHTNYWDINSEASLQALANALKLRRDNNP